MKDVILRAAEDIEKNGLAIGVFEVGTDKPCRCTVGALSYAATGVSDSLNDPEVVAAARHVAGALGWEPDPFYGETSNDELAMEHIYQWSDRHLENRLICADDVFAVGGDDVAAKLREIAGAL